MDLFITLNKKNNHREIVNWMTSVASSNPTLRQGYLNYRYVCPGTAGLELTGRMVIKALIVT